MLIAGIILLIFGVLSVIGGGVLSGFSNYLLEIGNFDSGSLVVALIMVGILLVVCGIAVFVLWYIDRD